MMLEKILAEREKVYPSKKPESVPGVVPDATLADLWRGIVHRYHLRFTIRATTYSVLFAIGLALGSCNRKPCDCVTVKKHTITLGDNRASDIGIGLE